MAGFYEGVSNPGSVTGSTPVHESVASSIGAALGGAAKLLDVGLKADHEDRMNKLDVEIGDKLADVTKAITAPKDQAGIFVEGDLQPWERAQGLDKIGNLAQAHFHSPDKVSFSTLMGRASAITQEIIHAHPRYADEIRGRVQKILGINPNEELIKQTLDDEQAVKRAQLEVKMSGAKAAQDAGYPMQTNSDGSPDWDNGYKSFAVHQKAVAEAEALARSDAHEREQLEIEKLRNPGAKPETEDGRQVRVQNKIMAFTDGPYNEVMNGNLKSLLQQIATVGAGGIDETAPTHIPMMSGSQRAEEVLSLREQAINGLAFAKTNVARIVNNLRETAMKGGSDTKVEDWDKVIDYYNKQIDDIHNQLVTAPSEVVEARAKNVTSLQSKLKANFLEANHTIAVVEAMLGPGNPAIGAIWGDAIIRNPEVNAAMQQAATSALGGTLPPSSGGKGEYTPTVPAQQNPVGLLHTTANNIVGTVSGAIESIPDRITAKVLVGQMDFYGKNAGHLSSYQQMRYGQVADAIVRTGLKLTDVNQLGSAVSATSTPAQLRAFDGFVKQHPDESQKLGEKFTQLNRLYVQRAINSGTLQPTTGGSTLTFTPVYNPSAGRIELQVTDQHGRVVNPDVKYSPTPQYNGLPASLALHVQIANQAMAATAHLKEYGENASWQDLQIKQGMAAGLPLRPGTHPMELPTEKQNKAAPKKEVAPVKEAAKRSPVLYTSEDGYEISGTP